MKRQKALVIDQVPSFDCFFTLMLALLDWKPTVVTSEQDALKQLRTNNHDVLICEYNLPWGNAFAFICSLRRQGIFVPAVVITEKPEIEYLAPRRLLNLTVLLKPFSYDALGSALLFNDWH